MNRHFFSLLQEQEILSLLQEILILLSDLSLHLLRSRQVLPVFFFFFYKIRKKRISSATITLATDIEFSIYDDDVLKKEDSVNLNFSDNSDNKSGNEIINYYDKVIFQSVSYI